MIRKIDIKQLRKGMYVHNFNLKQTDKDISIRLPKALIKTDNAVKIIQSYKIDEIYIDTSKGVDVIKKVATSSDGEATNIIQPPSPEVPISAELPQAQLIKREAAKILSRTMRAIAAGDQINTDDIANLARNMERSVSRNRDALQLLTRIKRKDEYTLVHSISVGTLALAFCNALKYDYSSTINVTMGALLHDIGKTHIPLQILNKPGKLTSAEYDIIKRHANFSADVLRKTKSIPDEAFDIALHHHERYNGSGYPDRLNGNEIEFGSRLVALCDVYDAITSARCYKNGIDRIKALQTIYSMAGKEFDRELAHKFIKFVGVYPIGTCVTLSNGLTGIVSDTTKDILKPVVQVFYDNNQHCASNLQKVDLSQSMLEIVSYEYPEEYSANKHNMVSKLRRSLFLPA